MSTIRKGLERLNGVAAAQPDNVAGIVAVDFDEQVVSADRIATQLSEMGYPLVGNNDFTHKAKSYVSCAIGRIS